VRKIDPPAVRASLPTDRHHTLVFDDAGAQD
jgi:hypothetical protein